MPHLLSFLAILFAFAPAVVSADAPTTFAGLVNLVITGILTPLVALIFGLALVGFLWGVAQYVIKADDAKAQENAKNKMLYGIIALFVMVSVWGLVKILVATFGGEALFAIPQLQQQ